MRPTKVLGEDRTSTSKPEGRSEKAASLPETSTFLLVPLQDAIAAHHDMYLNEDESDQRDVG